ncbi:M23 family metallopeptidase [Mobilitalea sibirica]|uniref:M23 family metallopeptidase n=1 Tax=Mobilitalea sibirica TaxID=1462919 RepID=A0A8J7H0Y5_9FIRM|nr:M23 family metallopeptidase [Mobilitalea sibirica]MBH1939914.1 M23 family metallopeptidase [Mobilitalea sibirica]
MISWLLKLIGHIPLFIQYLIIPIVLIIWIIRNSSSKMSWLLKVAITGFYLLIVRYSASFHISIGYYTFFIILAFYFIGVFLSLKRTKQLTFIKKDIKNIILYSFSSLLLSFLIFLSISIIRAYSYETEPINLAFPFKNGKYIVNEGGDGKRSFLVNSHYNDSANNKFNFSGSMQYAVDIRKINNLGFDSNKLEIRKGIIMPEELSAYHIFDEILYSPCDGIVTYAIDRYNDELPDDKKRFNNFGNGIVIKQEDVFIVLWHTKKDSHLVSIGDYVKAGQPIAKIGNSGHSSTPHLHIYASKGDWLKGEGVPIVFNHKNPVKNRIFNIP